ncbi:hypothetical protein F0562_001806 [Nyssa sinensis]|uniref:RING-type E3 ubiquitin transferase n=1 Tax=Nyssa sinensis TaxID=561372 RepID=A0A5J5C834_9ASTE|nr:hypothetical protein F0562_001806 [Nyssa sinensis]
MVWIWSKPINTSHILLQYILEVLEMEEATTSENHLTSAAAFVEGGIQEACDDACSICLEAFCESDPSTVTGCKHEFHLQCILEWCQRSSQCPMCWQPISLKDPSSQELLDAIERERNFRVNPTRSTTIFHHPTLGDFELQHLPVSATDSELEERIIQHLAAAAAMGRARRIARREGQRSREAKVNQLHAVAIGGPTSLIAAGEETTQLITPPLSAQANPVSASSSGSSVTSANHQVTSSNNRRSPTQSSPNSQDRPGPSDFQSFSESLKARFNAVSMRYKESITKSTRGWKERLFSRNTSVADVGPEVRLEANAGIATVSRMMEHLETRENSRTNTAVSDNLEDSSVPDLGNQQINFIFKGGVSSPASDAV